MARERPRELWHRLDNEPERAYEAFKVFMYLPPADRTPTSTWREFSANPDAKKVPDYFRIWSKQFAWSDRARAHDHHLEVIRESGQEEAIKAEAARQARQVELVRGRFSELMAMAYERAIEYLEGADFIKHLRPADVVQILKLHLETTHKLGDGQMETPGGSSAVDWSEDEQRELDKLLDEIDAEEAKRDSAEGEAEPPQETPS